MSGTPRQRCPFRRVSRALALTCVLAATTPSLASADQTVRLRSAFETQQASASLRVPDDWVVRTRSRGPTLTAPSRREDCDHVLTADLNALYVSGSATAAAWVKSRLYGKGAPIATGGAPDLAWAVATPKRSREAFGRRRARDRPRSLRPDHDRGAVLRRPHR